MNLYVKIIKGDLTGTKKLVRSSRKRLKILFNINISICSACKQELDLSYFYTNSHSKRGIRSECIDCCKDIIYRKRATERKKVKKEIPKRDGVRIRSRRVSCVQKRT